MSSMWPAVLTLGGLCIGGYLLYQYIQGNNPLAPVETTIQYVEDPASTLTSQTVSSNVAPGAQVYIPAPTSQEVGWANLPILANVFDAGWNFAGWLSANPIGPLSLPAGW